MGSYCTKYVYVHVPSVRRPRTGAQAQPRRSKPARTPRRRSPVARAQTDSPDLRASTVAFREGLAAGVRIRKLLDHITTRFKAGPRSILGELTRALAAMAGAAAVRGGLHDFTSFCLQQDSRPDGSSPTMVRRVTATSWRRVSDGPSGADLLEFEVSASAFCQRMVRSMVGTLVAVGRGEMAVDAMPAVLAARKRQAAADSAPAQGLVLWSVNYS